MSGIFPNPNDGGLPPNAADLLNPAHAYPPITPPINTSALYYGNGCDVRLRPEVVNSMISELEAICDEAKLAYDSGRLENVERAIRYLIQRGLTVGAVAVGGPRDYTAILDPTMTAYNNFMTLCVVPSVTNDGPPRINVDGRGFVPILRNDGVPLQPDDFRAGIPVLIDYQNGNFYLMTMARSQIPLIPMNGDIDGWIRTDGNDITGDGTANTAQKAFRTIQGAWTRLSRKYLPSPLYTIHLRLGIPGTYEAAALGPFGGRAALHGDPNNRVGYRIDMTSAGITYCLVVQGMTLAIEGVTLMMTKGLGYDPWCMFVTSGAAVTTFNVQFEALNSASRGGWIVMTYNSSFGTEGIMEFTGHGVQLQSAIWLYRLSTWYGIISRPTTFIVRDQGYGYGGYGGAFLICDTLSTWAPDAGTISSTNTFGQQYGVAANSIIYGRGQTLPGTIAGTASTGGLYIP